MANRNFQKTLGTTAIWLAMSGGAFADVTAQEVWDNWVAYSEGFGQTITVGSQEAADGSLTLHDVQIAFDAPEAKVSGTIQLIEFKERGDGTVAITMSEDVPLAVSAVPAAGEEIDLTLIFKQSGLVMVASGGDGTVKYDYSADQTGVSVDKLFVGGKDMAPRIAGDLTGVLGSSTIVSGDPKQMNSTFNASHAKIDVNFSDPETSTTVTATYDISDMAGTTAATFPENIDFADPKNITSVDVDVAANYSTGPITLVMDVQDAEAPFHLESLSQTTAFKLGLNQGTISYGGSSTGIEWKISSPAIPFPELTAGIEEVAFNLVMPLRKSDTPMDFALLTKIGGLKVDDMLWGMVDPTGTLPHDPATLILDLGGKLNWLVDISDPDVVTQTVEGEPPIVLEALTLNNATIAAAGANVSGTGAFTFDNTDTTTFDGMPAPTGSADFKIVGANGLIDKLIAMGLVPEEQAMGARMMLGMFARPGDGEDTLTSTIEVKPDGSILANGQRIK